MDFAIESIILTVDAIVFAICFFAYYKQKAVVSQIENAPHLDISNDLRNMVMVHPGGRIPYAAVQGVVKPIGIPIVSTTNPKVQGVVQCIILREHIAQLTDGHWSDRQRIIKKVRNVVPFMLTFEENCVKVVNPLAATLLDLETISDTYTGSAQEVVSHAWSHILGVSQTGVQRTEKMLQTGTALTAIGELRVSGDKKTVLVQPPSTGGPYFLTVMEISSLLAKLRRSKLTYGIICGLCFAIGVLICLRFRRKKKNFTVVN